MSFTLSAIDENYFPRTQLACLAMPFTALNTKCNLTKQQLLIRGLSGDVTTSVAAPGKQWLQTFDYASNAIQHNHYATDVSDQLVFR